MFDDCFLFSVLQTCIEDVLEIDVKYNILIDLRTKNVFGKCFHYFGLMFLFIIIIIIFCLQ
jgi:hypothetical protein